MEGMMTEPLEAAEGARLKGVVKTIKRQEGFGFITHVDTGIDHFFHKKHLEDVALWDTLKVDQPVAFRYADHPRGPRAEAVEVLAADTFTR